MTEPRMKLSEAASTVDALKVGDYIYTPLGDKVTITKIEKSDQWVLKFWYEMDDDEDIETWADRQGLIQRFVKFGPIQKINLTPPDVYEPYMMSRTEAKDLVNRLEPGHHIYSARNNIVILREVKYHPTIGVQFWYYDDNPNEILTSKVWSSPEAVIERFLKFGPIDNDPIIIHEERPMESRPPFSYQSKWPAKPEPQQKSAGKVSEPDMVNSPSHYTTDGIECIEAIKASMTPEAFKGYLKGNVMKYMWRYEKKINPAEDLKKARWYQDRLIKELFDA